MRLLAGIEMQNDLDGSLGMSPLREGGGGWRRGQESGVGIDLICRSSGYQGRWQKHNFLLDRTRFGMKLGMQV